MVKLNRIYTRTGDDGTTGLGTGGRVAKDDPRVEAYGSVDEANAALGVAIAMAGVCEPGGKGERIVGVLLSVQHDLFDLGADLCVPRTSAETEGSRLRVLPGQVERLERLIDEFNENLAPLTSFVLPGGSRLSSGLHLARTVVRRAERLVVGLRRAEPNATSEVSVRYLNRLSDLLFVLSRVANDNGATDTLWVPGANRVT
ncbi:MAG: cob(I)yrinic acid a,c-diamide adenosyltransferase [Phycisphaeraceae bacterium]|nr:cob(I)yrinic acid a,c-diamide adenosyltransferase [Phycisphaeraceae bacterium]